MKRFVLHLGLPILLASSCSSWWPFGAKKSDEAINAEGNQHQPSAQEADSAANKIDSREASLNTPPTQKNNSDTSQSLKVAKDQEEILLKQARIIARMEEIESELISQKEKIRLLEQGLLTGIAPNELKYPGPKSAHVNDQSEKLKRPGRALAGKPKHREAEGTLPTPEFEDLSLDASKVKSEGGESDYKVKMNVAREHYQSSRFGLAVADFAGIIKEYNERIGDGEARLWLGRSYLGLKEYATARGEFETYLKGWPTGEYAGSARLDLAKAYAGMGLKERARGELRRVIKDFEGQEISEIASSELNNLNRGL